LIGACLAASGVSGESIALDDFGTVIPGEWLSKTACTSEITQLAEQLVKNI
jgi:hypothetical protein